MPDYKKKKHNKIFSAPKPKKQKIAAADEDIKMTPAEKYRKTTVKTNMKVVKGKRLEQKRAFKAWVCIAVAAALIIGILELALPMGIYEKISHTAALIGTGNYPLELDGNQTLNTVSCGSYYYVLGSAYITAVSGSGKVLFSYAHGFENPVVKVSASRALVFEQNGTKALIFTLNGLKSSIDTENSIITAGISDSGAYALACRSDKYASAVTVYAKNGKTLYEWYSAEGTVNNAVLSPNGKKLVVSAFKSENGSFKSTVSVLNYKSATPEYSENTDNSLVYGIYASGRNAFSVITENSLEFIKWSDFKKTEYKSEYPISLFRTEGDCLIAVFNRKTDKTDNKIAVFSKTGKIRTEIEYKGIISDVSSLDGNVYCIGETELRLLGKNGDLLREASCGFGAVRISVISSNTVAVITDNKIEKIKLEQD